MQFKNQLIISCLFFLFVHAMHAYMLPDYLSRIGKKTLSLQHLCMYGTVYPLALDTLHQHMQDEIMWQKGSLELRTHDVSDLCGSIMIETCYAILCGLRNDQLQEHIVLTIYGALLHKCLQYILCACKLHDCVSDEIKQRYRLYGSSYVKALLACICSYYIDPSKYQ